VYAKAPGARIRIDNHGEVTDKVGLELPQVIADEVVKSPDLVIRRDPKPAAPAAEPAKTEKEK
jgi:hypothetical protein